MSDSAIIRSEAGPIVVAPMLSPSLKNWLSRADKFGFADLANAFENVPQAPLLQVLRKYIPVKPSEEIKRRQHNEKIHENLHSLLRKLIETPKRIGIRQGAATSSLFLNVYADHHLDRPWRRHCAAPLLRFADDILVPCTSSEEAEEAQATLMKLLAPTGLRCKEPKAGNKNIVDINRQEAEWLGYRIRWSSEGLIVLPGTRHWKIFTTGSHIP